jgi:hypothetical protein
MANPRMLDFTAKEISNHKDPMRLHARGDLFYVGPYRAFVLCGSLILRML